MASSSAAQTKMAKSQVSAVVKRYSCMYTPDVHKKAKKWHDGFIRLHHFNGKAFLFTLPMPNLPEGHLLSEVFVRPRVSSHSSKSPGHVGKTGGLPDDMVWPEGEEVEFDDAAAGAKQAYIATVGELVDEEVKDLTAALDPAVRKAAASKRKLDSREALDAFIESGEKRQREQTDDYRRVPGLRRDRPLQHASTTSTSAAPTGARGRTAAPATTTVSTIKPPVQATATARPAGKRLGVGRPRLIMQGTGVKVDWTRLSGS